MFDRPVVVRGGGDLGSGIALRLWRCGFPVVILESQYPVAVRRTVAFAEAVYDGSTTVEEAVGTLRRRQAIDGHRTTRTISVHVDPRATLLKVLKPFALVDAIMSKRDTGSRRGMAEVVAAIGPGFVAGASVDAVIETNRGPDLGRVIWSGSAQPDTGEPGMLGGQAAGRLLRAPKTGVMTGVRSIGEIVDAGDVVATVSGEQIAAPFRGLVRGLCRDGLPVFSGMKIGDIDPRLDPSLCSRVSDKSLAVAGGVLEAIFMSMGRRHEV